MISSKPRYNKNIILNVDDPKEMSVLIKLISGNFSFIKIESISFNLLTLDHEIQKFMWISFFVFLTVYMCLISFKPIK